MKHQVTLLGSMVMMSFAIGCGAIDAAQGEEDVASAELAQLDPGDGIWRIYTINYDNSAEFGTILVFGSSAPTGFRANYEYWYVNASNLQYLGTEDLNISYTDGTGTPPSYSNSQQFTLPAVVTWAELAEDSSSGYLYDNGNVHLRIFKNSSGITGVKWLQSIPTGSTPANLSPSGTFTVGSGTVTPGSGQVTYFVSQAL
ncbi:hypothetical protein [Polyangium jinanense]|uniref:Uncharacterized protein n=1 Tax=Polyangium jinanense TaxID=2829994 RepID=A0A9X3WY60_9BACT|nr:hypothetical protein [Polyangium jinanense]MDC3952868.1 hypothetical protein [Polyangium jinanense]MDC3980487.1 hypothetical protein [Polyangium jinanense]